MGAPDDDQGHLIHVLVEDTEHMTDLESHKHAQQGRTVRAEGVSGSAPDGSTGGNTGGGGYLSTSSWNTHCTRTRAACRRSG